MVLCLNAFKGNVLILGLTPSYIQLSCIQPLYLDCRWIIVKYWRLFNEIVMLSSWNVYILFKRYSWELLSCDYCVHGLVCSLVTSIFIFVDQNLVYMYHSMIEKYKIKEFKTSWKVFLILNKKICLEVRQIKYLPSIKQIPSSSYLQLMHLLSSSGPGHLHVNSKSLKSHGLFQISKRPGAWSYNCNVSTHHHHP